MFANLQRRILFKYRRERLDRYKHREQARRQACPANLMNFEEKHFSQNGEDGIIAEIFRRIGTTDKFFVEFGFGFNGDCLECNTAWLLEREGWSGLWMDGSATIVEQAGVAAAGRPVKILPR